MGYGQSQYEVSSVGTAKVFTAYATYNTPGTVAISLQAGRMHSIDLATIAAAVPGIVTCTFPSGAIIGQAIGIKITGEDGIGTVEFAGPVSSETYPMGSINDQALFTYDGTNWVCSSYSLAAGWLNSLGATAVGLYRIKGSTAFTPDFSGNGRSLSAAAAVIPSQGYRGWGSLKSIAGSIGTSANAAFQLQAAMSLIILTNVKNLAGGVFASCGSPGTGATNLQWSFGTQGSVFMQYFAETGAGVDVVYAPTTIAVLREGWQVIGFTRTAGGVVNLYGNGVLLATSGALTLPTGGGSSNLSIGAYASGANGCLAEISQVGVYSTELTPAQMRRAANILLGNY